MELLRLVVRYAHLVGFALLLGGLVVQYLSGRLRVNATMRAGLGTMLVTGLVLAIPFPDDVDLDYPKLGVKLLVALSIGPLFGVAVVRERRGAPVARAHFLAIGGLVLLNAAVAVFWR